MQICSNQSKICQYFVKKQEAGHAHSIFSGNKLKQKGEAVQKKRRKIQNIAQTSLNSFKFKGNQQQYLFHQDQMLFAKNNIPFINTDQSTGEEFNHHQVNLKKSQAKTRITMVDEKSERIDREIAELRKALAEAVDQNQSLRYRIQELESLFVQAGKQHWRLASKIRKNSI